MKKRLLFLLALAIAAVALAAPAVLARPADDATLSLVAYSTPKDAYATIIPAFQATPAGKGISFNQSYAASETQAAAVTNGLPADIVELSHAADMDRLVQAGLVSPDWNKNQYKGIVSRSVVVLVVRKGNPKHITGWGDLLKPGVEVVTPNPFTSGGARWNVMAAYGAQLKEGKTPAQAIGYLQQLFKHVVVQDKSARDALNTFVGGKGDVLITYENEALYARHHNADVAWIIPKATIRIENPIAVLKNSSHKAEAEAFVKFLYTPKGQTLFGGAGYRPVIASVAKKFNFPTRPQLFTIDYVGGWPAASTRFFDPTNGVMAKIEQGLGN
jgi:sulfate/thiosulfate transport system substrate-binding protein